MGGHLGHDTVTEHHEIADLGESALEAHIDDAAPHGLDRSDDGAAGCRWVRYLELSDLKGHIPSTI